MAVPEVCQPRLTYMEKNPSVVKAAGTPSKSLSIVLKYSEFYCHHQTSWSSEYHSCVVSWRSQFRISAHRPAFLTENFYAFLQSLLGNWYHDKWGNDCMLPRPLQFIVKLPLDDYFLLGRYTVYCTEIYQHFRGSSCFHLRSKFRSNYMASHSRRQFVCCHQLENLKHHIQPFDTVYSELLIA
jgi:hypothetical protein